MTEPAAKRTRAAWISCGIGALAGTFLALCLTGQGLRFLTPVLPLALPMATISVLALSCLCIWGLFFSIPLYFLWRAATRGVSLWRCALPVCFLQSGMTCLNHSLSGVIGWRTGAFGFGCSMVLLLVVSLACGGGKCFGHIQACWQELVCFFSNMRRDSAVEAAQKHEAEEEAKQQSNDK